MSMRTIAVVLLAFALPAWSAELSLRSESGRSVFRRGEAFDVALHVPHKFSPKAPASGHVELWLVGPAGQWQIASDAQGPVFQGRQDATYRIDTARIRPGAYRLRATAKIHGQSYEGRMPFEIADDNRQTSFKIHHMGMPRWVLPTGRLVPDSQRYHFNFMLANIADSWHRGAAAKLGGRWRQAEEMLRHDIDFLKYPTGYGWGLAHRPIRRGASWYDPDVIEASAQLMQYHMQAVRGFPNCVGLNPIDEPGVSWSDPHMTAAFKKATGLDAPTPEDRTKDPKRYLAYQTFRNHALNDFNQVMKKSMHRVAPKSLLTVQTFADILTRAGLYPAGNTFMDVQSTHIYDHWPTSNNWMAFDVNLRRANRKVFWNMPLYVVTGCYGILPDQWRSAWALGMSAKLDGHGYFLGAGELPEQQPFAEFSLAEMVRINRLNRRYGDLFLGLRKVVEPVALWYSFAQSALADPKRNYPQEVIGAFYALKRAHVPVTVVTDEDLRAGLLAEHKAILAVGLRSIPDHLAKAVRTFQAGGGKVVVDRSCKVSFAKPIVMDTDFRQFAASLAEVERAWHEGRQPISMLYRRDLPSEEAILRDLPVIERTFAPLVERQAKADSPHTFLAVQRHGQARYVFVANDASVVKHPTEKVRWINMQESIPAEDTLTLPLAKGKAIYDLFSGQRLSLDDKDRITLRLPPGGLRVLCVLPKRPGKCDLSAEVKARQVLIQARPAKGDWGLVPAELSLRDAKGEVVLHKFVAIDLAGRGENHWRYVLAVNDPPGKWRAELILPLTRESIAAEVTVPPPAAQTVVTRRNDCIMLDELACRAFKGRKPIVIVPAAGLQEQAKFIAQLLKAEVRKPEDIRKPDTYPPLLDPAKNKGVWMMPRFAPLNLTVGRANLVLLGTPENNILIKDINASGMLRRPIDRTTLGQGEGLVQYCWSPFDLDADAVIISAYDSQGLARAVTRFTDPPKNANGVPGRDTPLTGDLARVEPPGPVKAPQVVKPLDPTWSHRLDDGVRKLAAGGGIVAAAGMDSRLSVFDAAGKLLWRRDLGYRVIGVAVSADGDRIVAAAYPHTFAFDRKGTLLWLRAETQPSLDDVEALAVRATDDPKAPAVITGTWTGTVKALNSDGGRVWTFPAPPAKGTSKDKAPKAAVKPPKPLAAIRAAAFLPNGSAAIGSMKALVMLDANGAETKRVAFDRLQDLCPAGDAILVASFKKALHLLDAKGATLWKKPTPDFIMAADATSDGKIIAAALFSGEVLVLNSKGDILHHVRLPREATLTGIALTDDGKTVYLSTWEGDVLAWMP